MPEMIRVREAAEIKSVVVLAREIWNEHFVPIVGQEQIDYMLSKYQSAAAITQQIASGYEYFLVVNNHENVGYFAIVTRPSGEGTQLSKIYVREDQRGHGLGGAIMEFVVERSVEIGSRELWLTVNRHNAGPIVFYESMGFTKSDSLVQDIGNGFVMDDFRMVKKIG
jgi:GNAT superfamily N-acetyltransferase